MSGKNKEIAEYKGNGNAGGDNKNNNDKNDTNAAKNNNKNAKINLPNKLTIFRIILVPVYMIFILMPDTSIWSNVLAAALFLIAALTDLLDGLLARRLKLITNFGKLMDPLADKFMIMGAMIAITAATSYEGAKSGEIGVRIFSLFTVWATVAVFFREFAVTSIRLVAKSADDNVIAANFAGKLKTLSQCVCIMTILLEETVITKNLNTVPYLFSYITLIIMLLLTVYSGFVYFKNYWKYIDPAK